MTEGHDPGDDPDPVVTNVGPDQQDQARDLARDHARRVAERRTTAAGRAALNAAGIPDPSPGPPRPRLEPVDPARYDPAWGSLRVYVDGTEHPVHDDATGVRVTLLIRETGETAEVQVGLVRARGALVVILAGQVVSDRDSRGHDRFLIGPTP